MPSFQQSAFRSLVLRSVVLSALGSAGLGAASCSDPSAPIANPPVTCQTNCTDSDSGTVPPPVDPTGSCTNNMRDGKEEGLDCGGTCPLKCDGAVCTSRSECRSDVCANGKCAPSGSKTCGVGLAALCEDNDKCQQDADCKTDYCNGVGRCKPAPSDASSDGRRNAGETGVDCGGTAAPAKLCDEGQGCAADKDCVSLCGTDKLCQKASATDGKKNGTETDVDCGGAGAPACDRTKACKVDADCKLLSCAGGLCTTPTDSDGVQNGGETAVDCGGNGLTEGAFTYTAKRCALDQACVANTDCSTNGCSPVTKKCTLPSCADTRTAGLTTCGTGEPGAGNAVHESCCTSLPLPTLPRKLDKYEITAGRFRSFLDTVGPNIRAWAKTYAASHPGSQMAQLAGYTTATTVANMTDLYPATLNTGALNLVAHMSFDIDNYNGIRGCFNGYGDYGHNSYWQPDANLALYGIEPRPNPQSITDAKSLNCAMPIMLMAFCAWDGDGELAKLAEFRDAWGPANYPWGSTDILRPNYLWCNGRTGTGGWTCQDTSLGMAGLFYEYPAGTDLSKDQSPFFAAPGRFPMDVTAAKSGGQGWMDFFGNMAEYTGDLGSSNTFCDFTAGPGVGAANCTRTRKTGSGTLYAGVPMVGTIGRSWEGHNYGRGNVNQFAATFQYGKFGGRCSRPL